MTLAPNRDCSVSSHSGMNNRAFVASAKAASSNAINVRRQHGSIIRRVASHNRATLQAEQARDLLTLERLDVASKPLDKVFTLDKSAAMLVSLGPENPATAGIPSP